MVPTKVHAPSQHEVPQRVIDRIWDRYDVGGPDECWPWLLSIGSHGYGQVCWQVTSKPKKSAGTTAHRVAWIAANGPIPEGMTVDHNLDRCQDKRCGNPAHLRLLSNVENATDNRQGRKTRCPAGHPYSGPNLYTSPGGDRRCRTCAGQKVDA